MNTKNQNTRPSLAARLRYRFDAALARGPIVIIAWLGLLTLAVIAVTSLMMVLFNLSGVNGETSEHLGFWESLWQATLRLLDAGTFSGDVGFGTRVVGFLVTLSGIFIAGSLIGLIANAVDQRIEELRRGRSTVIEHDHSLILGWSERVPAIVSELVIANESRKRAAVVVVADHDKLEMEERLREAVPDTRTTKVVCRSGEPWNANTLAMANLAAARSVLVIGNGNDDRSVKTLLAIRAAQAGQRERSDTLNIVAELVDADTSRSVKSLMPGVVTVSSDAVVAELTAQACRQRGLSSVFRELLDFDGDEMYFAPFPGLVGRTYAEAQLAFDRAALMGILTADRTVVLGPTGDTVLAEGDELIGVVEDDSLFIPTAEPVQGTLREQQEVAVEETARRIVIAGWSSLGPRVFAELDEFLDRRTTIELVLDPELVNVDDVRAQITTRNVGLEVTALTGGPEVVASHAARHSFHEVIVLGYREALPIDTADTRTLLTLLAFNQVRQDASVGPVRIVAELLDQRNAPLAEATGVDDFVVSEELTSLMLAQLSERGELGQVFDDLFDRDGCSIELRPSIRYGGPSATCFADIVITAIAQGASAIGYRRADTGEVVVNPSKSAPLRLSETDEVLVVAAGQAAQ